MRPPLRQGPAPRLRDEVGGHDGDQLPGHRGAWIEETWQPEIPILGPYAELELVPTTPAYVRRLVPH